MNPLLEAARAPLAVVGTSIPNWAVLTEGAACAAAGTSSARASDNRTGRTFAGTQCLTPCCGHPASAVDILAHGKTIEEDSE
jgi:hypothetical protein